MMPNSCPTGGVGQGTGDRSLVFASDNTIAMSGSTIYLDDYHEIFFDISDERTMSGSTRRALDLWMDIETQIDPDELEAAVAAIERSNHSIEDVIDEVDTVQELIDYPEEIIA